MISRSNNKLTGDVSTVDNVRPTLAELVSAIEDASRQKPKQKAVTRNFARENVLRLRERQKFSRESQTATRVSPVKGLYRPQTGLSFGTGSRAQSCSQRAELRSGKIGSTCSSVMSEVLLENLDRPNSTIVEETDDCPARNCGGNNRQSVPKLPINGTNKNKESIQIKNDTEKSLLDGKTGTMTKQFSSHKLVRTSSAPSLASAKTSMAKSDRQLPAKYCYGSVPKYLVDRRKQWDRDALAKKQQEELEQSAPPGQELIPDEKRLETLHKLNEKYEDLLKKMTALPVRMDTLRVNELRKDLEKQLVKVEEAIKIFSQPKVFLKKDV